MWKINVSAWFPFTKKKTTIYLKVKGKAKHRYSLVIMPSQYCQAVIENEVGFG